MYQMITTALCPSVIILYAAANWKRETTIRFFGGSYTTPIPQKYMMQQLGLTLTKIYRMHLRKATGYMDIKPLKGTVAVAAPTRF